MIIAIIMMIIMITIITMITFHDHRDYHNDHPQLFGQTLEVITSIIIIITINHGQYNHLYPQTCGQPLFWKCPVFQAAASTDKAETVTPAQVWILLFDIFHPKCQHFYKWTTKEPWSRLPKLGDDWRESVTMRLPCLSPLSPGISHQSPGNSHQSPGNTHQPIGN